MKNELALVREDLTVDSRIIAHECGIKNSQALELLIDHKESIENQLGIIRFETEKTTRDPKGRGRPEKYALLTEDQAYALTTMFQNKPVVVEFKVKLVKAFSELRKQKQQPRLPSYSELAQMFTELQRTGELKTDIMSKIMPVADYGSIAKNGLPRVGIRRAAFVAATHRIYDAGKLMAEAAQLELRLLSEGEDD